MHFKNKFGCSCLICYGGVQHIMCCGFVFYRLVYSVLRVSLDCPFLIAPSVFSNVYLQIMNHVVNKLALI